MPREPLRSSVISYDDELAGAIYRSPKPHRNGYQIYRIIGRIGSGLWLFERLDNNAQGARGTVKTGNGYYLNQLTRIDK